MKVNALDEDSLTMDLEFRIQETTCRKESEADPATCDFQRGYHVVSVGQRPPARKQMQGSSAFLHHPEQFKVTLRSWPCLVSGHPSRHH